MGSFKDLRGREWPVEITIGTAMRLKDAGVDFLALSENEGKAILELRHDDIKFASLLFAVLKPDCDRLGVAAEDFYSALAGDALNDAWEVFGVAYLGFIRSPAIRSALRKGLDELKRMEAFAGSKMVEAMTRLTALGIERAERMAATTLNDAALSAILDKHSQSAPPKSGAASGAPLAS